jgi:serine/threonine protein kinase
MPAPTTSADFLDVLRKSKQVDPRRIDEYLARPKVSTPQEPRKLALQLIRAGLITVFQAEQFLLGKTKGFVLGAYRIIERIGTGGTGTVYLAEHQVMKRRVAIKVLPTPLAADPVIRERFRREAQAAAILDHENVVHVYDFREEGGLHAIIMEYVEGPSLEQLISKRGALPIATSCEYIRQAALGLQHAHEQGLVHRDVKPANLLVDASGLVKVLDLGLARYEAEGESSLTRQFNSKMVMGTADYLAPEQAISLHEVDHRADIYALGATLYALLAGKPPFADGSIGQKLLWHQTQVPEPIDKLRPEVPPALASLVARMLAKKPDDRPSSCAQVARELEEWACPQGQPLDVTPSQKSLAEFTLHGRGALPPVAPSSRDLASKSQAGRDTISGKKDTTSKLQPDPQPRLALAGRLLVLSGALALAVGALAGVVLVLMLR